MPTESMDEYVEAIYRLGGDEAPVSVADVAARLSISAVSANEMVKRLELRGFVEYERYHGIRLTESGRRLALHILRCHRLWERFLTDTLGLPWDLVHDEACRFEHITSPLVEERLAAFLGDPASCPHGSPVPGAEGEESTASEMALARLRPGQRAMVSRLLVEEPELLRYIDELGLRPLANIEVVSVAPFGGPLFIRIDGVERAVGGQVAATVLVCVPEDPLLQS